MKKKDTKGRREKNEASPTLPLFRSKLTLHTLLFVNGKKEKQKRNWGHRLRAKKKLTSGACLFQKPKGLDTAQTKTLMLVVERV